MRGGVVGCWSYINVHGCLLYLYKDTLHKYLLHTMACKICNKNFYFWFRSMQKFIRFDWWLASCSIFYEPHSFKTSMYQRLLVSDWFVLLRKALFWGPLLKSRITKGLQLVWLLSPSVFRSTEFMSCPWGWVSANPWNPYDKIIRKAWKMRKPG